ncbi:MAG TPA: hypothetical protein VMW52_01555, partial [Phycisphaerae bacterium]|nr:hypothetical protein [Phycisphaerae bacterium]
MSLDGLKTQFALLLSAAVETTVRAGRELRQVRGTALYDSRKDLLFTSLEPFGAVEAGLRELEQISERYGVDQSHRIALQLVYEYFARAKGMRVDSALIEALWADFVAELDSSVWLTRCVTNLRHFHCGDLHVDLGDGVSIYGRDLDVLARLGFHEGIWERLAADWSGFGASSFVLVAETSISKRPDNFIMLDNVGAWLRCARAIGAMRLVAPGDVGISATFVQRVARFNVGIGGIHSTGSTLDTIGNPYNWSPERRPMYDVTYTAL